MSVFRYNDNGRRGNNSHNYCDDEVPEDPKAVDNSDNWEQVSQYFVIFKFSIIVFDLRS